MTPPKLSPTTLQLFLNCPRLFWLDKNRTIKRPRGIFPSLPSGMDRVIKDYFDGYRSEGGQLPPEMQTPDFNGYVLFEDQGQLDRWRDWKTGPRLVEADGAVLFGAVDDLLVHDGAYVPFDYKTKGSPATQESAERYYTIQLDCYALLLEAQGLQTAGEGILLFYSPKNVAGDKQVRFEVQPIKIGVDPGRARKVFHAAVELLKGPLPGSSHQCEYCSWLRHFKTPYK